VNIGEEQNPIEVPEPLSPEREPIKEPSPPVKEPVPAKTVYANEVPFVRPTVTIS